MRAAALAAAIVVLPTTGLTQSDPAENAIKARQGFMRIQLVEAGPLFGMAKGDVAYDSQTAADNARNLNALVQYDLTRLFVSGSSKTDRPGKTRALAAIWEKPEDFAQAFRNLQEKVALVAEEAGNGKDALTAAVSEMGKACGNCHDNFRAEEF